MAVKAKPVVNQGRKAKGSYGKIAGCLKNTLEIRLHEEKHKQ